MPSPLALLHRRPIFGERDESLSSFGVTTRGTS